MKGKNQIILIVVGILAVVGLIAVFIAISNSGKEFRWYQDYRMTNDQPYGGMVLANLLQEVVGDEHFEVVSDTIYRQFDLDSFTLPSSYVYLGEELYLDSAELDFILQFVSMGNNAYIISEDFHWDLLDTLLEDGDYDEYYYGDYGDLSDFMFWHEDTIANLDLAYTNSLPDTGVYCKYLYKHKTQDHYWRNFIRDIDAEMDLEVEYLGYMNEDYLNYLRVSYGEGAFYLHSTPLAFSNYYLIENDNFEYVKEVFADLNTEKLLWDEINRNYQWVPSEWDHSDDKPDEGPLTFIFSEPGLKWAWFLSLLGILLFIILGMRRKQRIIPVLESNDNTSIEYSETLSQLYIQQRDHRRLCQLKMTLFLAFIRERYGLRTNVQNDKDARVKLMKKISVKSNVPEDQVQSIFERSDKLKVIFEVKNKELVEFHDQLEDFYKNCK